MHNAIELEPEPELEREEENVDDGGNGTWQLRRGEGKGPLVSGCSVKMLRELSIKFSADLSVL